MDTSLPAWLGPEEGPAVLNHWHDQMGQRIVYLRHSQVREEGRCLQPHVLLCMVSVCL